MYPSDTDDLIEELEASEAAAMEGEELMHHDASIPASPVEHHLRPSLVDLLDPEPVMDGSIVGQHTGYDREQYVSMVARADAMQALLVEARAKCHTAEALVFDVWLAYYKRNYMIAPNVPLKTSYNVNASLLDALVSTVEYDVLHRSVRGDPLGATMAALAVAPKLLESLSAGTLEQLEAAGETDAQIAALEAAADDAARESSLLTGQSAADMAARARELLAKAKELLAAAEPPTLSEGEADQARRGGRAGSTQAQGEVDTLRDILGTFGGGAEGYGQGGSQGGGQGGAGISEKLNLAKDVTRNQKLRKIAELAGRLQRIAMNVQRTKVDYEPNEIAGLELDSNLKRTLRTEFLHLLVPETEVLFYKKFAMGELLQTKLEPKHKAGRGPIVLAIDESGSMWGDPDIWAKSVALALLSIARKQKRDVRIIHFADGAAVLAEDFTGGHGTPSQMMAMADHFYGGGTDYDGWVALALEAVESSTFSKADVILVSDGAAGISRQSQARWRSVRERTGMRAMGVLIGTQDYHGLLSGMVDAVISLDDLSDTKPAEELLFSV